MQMTWRIPPAVADRMGLSRRPANLYTLSSAEFAGRLTQATGTAYDEDLQETERQYHVMRLARAAAKAVMQRSTAAQIVMDCGGFQVFEILELIDETAGLEWLNALFAIYIDQRFDNPASISTDDFTSWARVLSDDEIAAIAAGELPVETDTDEEAAAGIRWLVMDGAAQLYLALQQPLRLPEPEPQPIEEQEIPMTVPEPELAAAVPGQQFSLPLEADLSLVGTQAEGDNYGSQKGV